MPENCTTTCEALDETVQGTKLTVTGNEFSPNGDDCIHGIPVGDEFSLKYPAIPVYDPPASPFPSSLTLKDWTDDNPVLVGGAFALNERPKSIPNVLTNAGGNLTVASLPSVSQPSGAVFVSQRGFIPDQGAESAYFLASEIPDYDAEEFEFQGNTYSFSSLNYSTLGARRIVRICDGKESCNIELIRASSGEVDPPPSGCNGCLISGADYYLDILDESGNSGFLSQTTPSTYPCAAGEFKVVYTLSGDIPITLKINEFITELYNQVLTPGTHTLTLTKQDSGTTLSAVVESSWAPEETNVEFDLKIFVPEEDHLSAKHTSKRIHIVRYAASGPISDTASIPLYVGGNGSGSSITRSSVLIDNSISMEIKKGDTTLYEYDDSDPESVTYTNSGVGGDAIAEISLSTEEDAAIFNIEYNGCSIGSCMKLQAPAPKFVVTSCPDICLGQDNSDVLYSDTIYWEYSVEGTPEKGETITVTATISSAAEDLGYSLSGPTEWTFTYPTHEQMFDPPYNCECGA